MWLQISHAAVRASLSYSQEGLSHEAAIAKKARKPCHAYCTYIAKLNFTGFIQYISAAFLITNKLSRSQIYIDPCSSDSIMPNYYSKQVVAEVEKLLQTL